MSRTCRAALMALLILCAGARPAGAADLPVISLHPATHITDVSATLQGTVNPNGQTTSVWFEWGETSSYGLLSRPILVRAGGLPVVASHTISGLSPQTTYHFRMAARNDSGVRYSPDRTFATSLRFAITRCAADQTFVAGADGPVPLPDLTGEVALSVSGPAAGSLVVTQSPEPGTLLELGPTTVTLTATDGIGRAVACHAIVTVTELTGPTLECPPWVNVVAAPGQCEAVADFTATATDAWDPAPVVACQPQSGTVLPVGRTEVTCVAFDRNGNSSSRTFPVTVVPGRTSPAGETWTASQSVGGWLTGKAAGWQSVASSGDGTRLVAVDGSRVFTSIDFGARWTPIAASPPCTCIASSADGAKLIAARSGGQVYTSTDSGATWTVRMHRATRAWSAVASSADGNTLVAVASPGHVFTSTNSGVGWTERLTDAARKWSSVAASADGTTLVAADGQGHLFTSTNSGVGWAERLTVHARGWESVASSGDGSVLVASNGVDVYISNDAGVTWRQTRGSDFPVGGSGWVELGKVASSVSGTKLLMTSTTYWPVDPWTGRQNRSFALLRSTDAGMTWRGKWYSGHEIATNMFSFLAVASSADGDTLVVTGRDLTGYGSVWASKDSGDSWELGATYTESLPDLYPTSVASSRDGTNLVMLANAAQLATGAGTAMGIYVSPDSGATWKRVFNGGPWKDVASSEDGARLVAVASPGFISTSSDGGVTWTEHLTDAKRLWQSVASSANGAKLIAAAGLAVGFTNGLFTSADSGMTWTAHVGGTRMSWHAVASSADGTRLVAAAYDGARGGGSLVTSSNSGATWTTRMADSRRVVTRIASSSDGARLVAAAGGLILTSTDSGVTWIERMSTVDPAQNWLAVASSYDGTRLIATAASLIRTSTDGGATWATRTQDDAPWAIASSGDGTRLVGLFGDSSIATSTDGVRGREATFFGVTNRIVAASRFDGAVVNFTVGASNLCLPNVPVISSPESGSVFPFGETTVLCTARLGSIWDYATFTVTVTPRPEDFPNLTGGRLVANRAFWGSFTGTPGGSYTVIAAPDITYSIEAWRELGLAAEMSPGFFEFLDTDAMKYPRRFYRVRWP